MIGERQLRPALGAVLLVLGLALAAFVVYPHPDWTPDGYVYAVRMLMDVGLPYEDALHQAQRFWQQQPIAAEPLQAPLFRGEQAPLYWDVFKPRVLYPFLASLLYPTRGFFGMIDLSAIAFVATSLAVYYLALQFTGAVPSFAVTLGFMLFPATLEIARYSQTDMLAMLFSTLCLVALVRVGHGGDRPWVALLAAACLLLVFTRPAFYMPIGGAIGLAIGLRKAEPAVRRLSLFCVGITLFCGALYIAVALASGTPSFSYVIADARNIFFNSQDPAVIEHSFFSKLKHRVLRFSPDDPLAVWYAKMIVDEAFRELIRGTVVIFPIVAFFGLSTLRRNPAFGALAGTGLALCLVLALDPISLDMNRVFEFPMLPILAVGLAAVISLVQARLGLSLPAAAPASTSR
jgi:4-amino-4-deoxy-L-arabinose transferase-like glycosyltransferase